MANENMSVKRQTAFCRAYLRTMDPDQAAAAAGVRDGFALLSSGPLRERLEKMREAVAGQLLREDAVRRLAQLAFGRANDAVRLALHRELDPEELDLSAVSEFKVTDKGGMEVKLLDRVRALETLCSVLGESGSQGIEELLRALEEPEERDNGGA